MSVKETAEIVKNDGKVVQVSYESDGLTGTSLEDFQSLEKAIKEADIKDGEYASVRFGKADNFFLYLTGQLSKTRELVIGGAAAKKDAGTATTVPSVPLESVLKGTPTVTPSTSPQAKSSSTSSGSTPSPKTVAQKPDLSNAPTSVREIVSSSKAYAARVVSIRKQIESSNGYELPKMDKNTAKAIVEYLTIMEKTAKERVEEYDKASKKDPTSVNEKTKKSLEDAKKAAEARKKAFTEFGPEIAKQLGSRNNVTKSDLNALASKHGFQQWADALDGVVEKIAKIGQMIEWWKEFGDEIYKISKMKEDIEKKGEVEIPYVDPADAKNIVKLMGIRSKVDVDRFQKIAKKIGQAVSDKASRSRSSEGKKRLVLTHGDIINMTKDEKGNRVKDLDDVLNDIAFACNAITWWDGRPQ